MKWGNLRDMGILISYANNYFCIHKLEDDAFLHCLRRMGSSSWSRVGCKQHTSLFYRQPAQWNKHMRDNGDCMNDSKHKSRDGRYIYLTYNYNKSMLCICLGLTSNTTTRMSQSFQFDLAIESETSKVELYDGDRRVL